MSFLVRLTNRRTKAILYVAGLVFIVAGAIGSGAIAHLSNGGFTDPSTQSAKASKVLATDFHTVPPNLVLLLTDPRGVDDSTVAATGESITRRLAGLPDVLTAASYWSLGRPAALRGKDGRRAIVYAEISGSEDQVQAWAKEHGASLSGSTNGTEVQLGGAAEANLELTNTTESDLIKIEGVTLPLILIGLVLVFGSLVAAALPLVTSAVTIVLGLMLLRVLTWITPVSVLATNVTTGLGLALAIDYSLFIITRYREEIRAGHDVHSAVATAIRTAGRTVLFSALTLALSLSALLVFPFYFLRSFAYAGIPTTVFAAACSLTILPALLLLLGPRVEKIRIFRQAVDRALTDGFWHRLAMRVMRFPVPIALSVIALLLLLGAPFLGLKIGLADDRVLPSSTSAHQVGQILRTQFSADNTEPLDVVLSGSTPTPERAAAISAYAARMSALPNVAEVDTLTGTFASGRLVRAPVAASAAFAAGDNVYLSVVSTVEAQSTNGQQLVSAVRALPAPARAQVAGAAADLTDSKNVLYDRLPVAFAIVAISSLVMIFLFTGSVLLPFKALVLNCLSLSATFGVLVWGFQDGHLNGLVGHFTPTGTITWTVPILLFCIAFGLSMDYEVFLLSRIKEEYDSTGDNTTAVARGLERVGKLVTSAAALVAIVFLGFILSGITYLKAIGVGLALAVLMDATLVRGALVPALMRLAGRANWWAPGPLRRLYERLGLHESPPARGDQDAPTSSERLDALT